MKVWRIHIKTDKAQGLKREDLLDFCIKEKLIGVGWRAIDTKVNDETIIREQAQFYSDPTRAIKAMNAMRAMQINDLIWTRLGIKYYLCRVTGLWVDREPNEEHLKFDISNYVNVEWLEIGMEQDVPGKVVSSFRPPAAVQSINDIEEISQYIWNKYSGKALYKVAKKDFDIWPILSDKAIEELVLLYLQIEKGYYIYSSTVKKTFPKYECEMVNKDGIKAYPQVKSGKVHLKADDYMDVIKNDPLAEVYLFTASESYTPNECGKVHYLYRRDLEEFIVRNKQLLPKMTYDWINLCGFFDKEQG